MRTLTTQTYLIIILVILSVIFIVGLILMSIIISEINNCPSFTNGRGKNIQKKTEMSTYYKSKEITKQTFEDFKKKSKFSKYIIEVNVHLMVSLEKEFKLKNKKYMINKNHELNESESSDESCCDPNSRLTVNLEPEDANINGYWKYRLVSDSYNEEVIEKEEEFILKKNKNILETEKIIGGEKVEGINNMNFMGMVYILFFVEDIGLILLPFCGITIFDPYWALTAGHCIFDFQDNFDFVVRSGFKDLDGYDGDFVFVEKTIVHENYDQNNFRNDIALLKLVRETSSHCVNLDITGEIKNLESGTDITVSGWGVTCNNNNIDCLKLSQYLLKTTIPLQGFAPYTDDKVFLLNGNYENNTCFGDSGGPALYKNENTYIQLGIISYTVLDESLIPCQSDSGYTSVYSYIDWILKNTNLKSLNNVSESDWARSGTTLEIEKNKFFKLMYYNYNYKSYLPPTSNYSLSISGCHDTLNTEYLPLAP